MTPRLLGRMASESGLSETKVKNGLGGAVASIFGGLAGKASDKGVMNRVADLVATSPDVDVTSTLDDTSPLKGPSNQLLGLATGDGSSLTSRIASMLGIGGKAAGGLVAAASSLAIAAFKRIGRASGGLDANKLANTLIDERQEINAHLPAGMATATATATTRARAYDRGETYAQREEVERAPSRAWWWLVVLIPLALLAYWLFSRSRTREETAPSATPPAQHTEIERTAPDTTRPQPVVPPPATAPQTEPSTQPGSTAEPDTGSQPGSTAEPGSQPDTTQGIAPQTEPSTQPGSTAEPGSQPDTTQGIAPQTEPSTQPGSTAEPDTSSQPGSTAEPGSQPGTVPAPPEPDTTGQPQHPGATPMAPNAGPRDTEPSAELDFPAGSVESRFLTQVKSPSGGESTWFELDQVTFATGKADLEAASQEQIKNIADILKANPDVKVRIGGFTDSTGTAATNQRLSQQRAESVKQALVAQGIDADRIDTKGYADQHKAVQTRGSEQQNRRAAIRVLPRDGGGE